MAEFPQNAFAGSVTAKADDWIELFPVQAFDGVTQSAFRIFFGNGGQRIVDVRWPAFFLKRTKDRFLVSSPPFKFLDKSIAYTKLVSNFVPTGLLAMLWITLFDIGSILRSSSRGSLAGEMQSFVGQHETGAFG